VSAPARPPAGAVAPAPALAVRGLTVRRGRLEVLRGIDLELRRGEVTVLLGPNGAGKSTLFGAVMGSIEPAGGRIEVEGRVAAAAQNAAFARRGVRANVELALAWWGVPRSERPRRAAAALAELGVGGLAERPARVLSGGEARRVHLARVLAVRPDVLLLDEPFAGLDPTARADVLYDLAAVLRDEDRATCVVVHDRAEAWALADRVLVLLAGRIAASGPPAEVLERPPSPAVARFLGFSGEIAIGDEVLMLRPGQVRLDPGGDLGGEVARKIPVEDGVRLELAVAGGRVFAVAPSPGPAVGERVALRAEGGIRFPRAAP